MGKGLYAAAAGLFGVCLLGLWLLLSCLGRADFSSLAPAPPEPQMVAAQRLPRPPKPPKFEFFTPPKAAPQPARAELPAQEPEEEAPAAPSLEQAAQSIFKAVKKPKPKARQAFQRMNFSNPGSSSFSQGGQGAAAASEEEAPRPVGMQPEYESQAPGPGPAQGAPAGRRPMRSVAPRGSVEPSPAPSQPPAAPAYEAPAPEEPEE